MHEREPHDNGENGAAPAEGAGASPETGPELRPRIFVASLSDYNHGVLHGDWLDAAVEANEVHAGIERMLDRSPTARYTGQPAEEWAIHDYENFGPLRIGEYESVEWITEVARGIAEHGAAFAAWANHAGSDRESLAGFQGAYLGEWESVEDYAAGLLDDLGATAALAQLDEWLQPYVDLDVAGFARDLEVGGDITTVEKPDGGVWVFDPANADGTARR